METAAIVLAAGRSSRMGGPNKLLEPLRGRSLLVHALTHVSLSRARPVIVVTGHRAEEIERAIAGFGCPIVHNPAYADGLSTSLKAGIAAVPSTCEAALIVLGDMPGIGPDIMDRLISDASRDADCVAAVPCFGDAWGNPVLLKRVLFPEIARLAGDQGARKLLQSRASEVLEVPVDAPGVLQDIDTPEALARARDEARAG
jgi:molybdenum cofactor cytidylyltransferase